MVDLIRYRAEHIYRIYDLLLYLLICYNPELVAKCPSLCPLQYAIPGIS